jgi:hypothetical protein
MREAMRENTRCGLRPMSDKAACQNSPSPEGCDENGPAAALLLNHAWPPDMLLRRAWPAAHFDRNAATPATDLVHKPDRPRDVTPEIVRAGNNRDHESQNKDSHVFFSEFDSGADRSVHFETTLAHSARSRK